MPDTLAQYLTDMGITMTARRAGNNPHMRDMPPGSSHWCCTFKAGVLGVDYRELVTFYSMGPAHTRPPEVGDVLDCLASDAAGFDNARSFDEWAREYGYDTDSRKAERLYHTVKRQAHELRAFVGSAGAFARLLYDVERQ